MPEPQQPDTKEKIFNAAAKLFATEGFYRISVREICNAAGVTKPVLYYYFKDKENLLIELVKETHSIGARLMENYIKEENDLITNLKGLISIYEEFIRNYPHLIRFGTFVQFMSVPESVKKIKHENASQNLTLLGNFFEDAKKTGVIKKNIDTEILVVNFIGTIIMLITKYAMYENDVVKFSQKAHEFLDIWTQQFVVN